MSVAVIVAAAVLVLAGSGQCGGHAVKRSDDTSLENLQQLIEQQAAVIQQQAAAIQRLQADQQALKAVTDTLNVTVAALTKSVAFTVRFAADDMAHGVTFGSDPVLRFDAVVTNIGSGYDPLTGLFTAPVSGTYVFFLAEMSPNQVGPVFLAIVKNGQVLDETYSPGTFDPDDQGSTSQVTTRLRAGERVWVSHLSGTGIRGSFWTVFTGFLLQAQPSD